MNAITPFEAGMLLENDFFEFQRVYENMRHALRRRKGILEKYGRQDTAGYERLVEALNTTRGNRSAENFSALSIALNSKMTLYTQQIKAEKRFTERIKEKYGVDLTPDDTREVMRRMNLYMKTKEGRLKYKEDASSLWDTAVTSVSDNMTRAQFMKMVGDLL